MPETSSYGYTTLPASRKRRLVRDHFEVMEFSIPETAWIRRLYHLYSFQVMPRAGRLICGTAAPFQYLAESVRVFPDPDRIRLQLTELGFEGAGFERLHNGLAVLFSGTKADEGLDGNSRISFVAANFGRSGNRETA